MARNHRSPGFFGRIAASEAAPGIALMACAAVALALANSPLSGGWHDLFHHNLGWSPVAKLDTLHLWINDGLMAVFFFVMGLEIKREVVAGELSDAHRRRLPIVAALAGMAMPALVYLFATRAHPVLHAGWAIPAATDIAFAMGVLALAGPRVPPSIRLFLLTVAIVDDLGAVAVIALFYTAGIKTAWLAGAGVVLAMMIALNRFGVRRIWPYVVLAVALWFAVLHSGVHATVAGVLAAFTVPMALDKRRHDSPLLRLEHALVIPNGFFIVPLFGLANAGVAFGGGAAGAVPTGLPMGIAAGLFIGKQVGIFGSVLLCERLGIAARPAGASALQLWGMALLCGIGFTMSLFIAALAFPDAPALAEEAKIGILGGSLLSALAGFLILRLAPPARPSHR
jgi:NhaA family Na+:H+ antiporter